jgi:5-methylcytosine-specific restriction enzyme B
MPYVTAQTLLEAIYRLRATANHPIKIWFTLKQMGMTQDNAVQVDTRNSAPALIRLFDYHHPEGQLFVPFGHTPRWRGMEESGEAARSIIQTNINNWVQRTVKDIPPFLNITKSLRGPLLVKPGRSYPTGLGHGRSGFALSENQRVAIPLQAFAVWYYRETDIPDTTNLGNILRQMLQTDLGLTLAEMELVFVDDTTEWIAAFQARSLTDKEIYDVVSKSIDEESDIRQLVIEQSFEEHALKVRSMVSLPGGPSWLLTDPEMQLRQLIEQGSKAILLYGSPRTGKTHAIDLLYARNAEERETIQIHDGWGYDDLVLGLKPDAGGDIWAFQPGPLLNAIRGNKEVIVLEEINRTDFSQAIGEVFSLLEVAYRGQDHAIRLRDGSEFYIPAETIIICTMNTLDRSTEEIDDALFGRMDAVEFPPRIESLHQILEENGVTGELSERLRQLFATIQDYYPLGHAYFAPLRSDDSVIDFYMTRIRPVLQKHMKNYRDQDLATIDNKVDQLFGNS